MWLWTLTYDLNLRTDRVRMNQSAKFLCQRSFTSKVIAWTHRHTWTHPHTPPIALSGRADMVSNDLDITARQYLICHLYVFLFSRHTDRQADGRKNDAYSAVSYKGRITIREFGWKPVEIELKAGCYWGPACVATPSGRIHAAAGLSACCLGYPEFTSWRRTVIFISETSTWGFLQQSWSIQEPELCSDSPVHVSGGPRAEHSVLEKRSSSDSLKSFGGFKNQYFKDR